MEIVLISRGEKTDKKQGKLRCTLGEEKKETTLFHSLIFFSFLFVRNNRNEEGMNDGYSFKKKNKRTNFK